MRSGRSTGSALYPVNRPVIVPAIVQRTPAGAASRPTCPGPGNKNPWGQWRYGAHRRRIHAPLPTSDATCHHWDRSREYRFRVRGYRVLVRQSTDALNCSRATPGVVQMAVQLHTPCRRALQQATCRACIAVQPIYQALSPRSLPSSLKEAQNGSSHASASASLVNIRVG